MTTISPPNLHERLAPILSAIPPAAASPHPAEGVLPFLSPILRQRVNILSSSSTDPWLRLLCYDVSKSAQLTSIAASGALEPHPVSGEVEIDWDYDAQTRYRRLDNETLQALVVLSEIGLAFQLVYCINDAEGGGDGWRVGELTPADKSSPFAKFGGETSIADAERQFKDAAAAPPATSLAVSAPAVSADIMDEDDDDGYWAQYDATPANRTPADNRSPAPAANGGAPASYSNGASSSLRRDNDDDDDYYAQYDDVQPAMDNYDPDEADAAAEVSPPLGFGLPPSSSTTSNILAPAPIPLSAAAVAAAAASSSSPPGDTSYLAAAAALAHPRPESSASSNGSQTVARLEATAGMKEQSEFGVKQHVSRSIRSLFLLSRASGIDREEFSRLVQTEMDLLSLSDEE